MKKKQYYFRTVLAICLITIATLPLIDQPTRAEPSSSLFINEVMYHPSENENTNEWIELYNPTSLPIDVAGWSIADEKETDSLQADTDHGGSTTSIPPGCYAIITDKGTTVYNVYNIDDNVIRLCVDDSTLCGYGLNNQKEKLLLLDATDGCIDALEWGEDYEDVPGSPALLVFKGGSLGRSTDTDFDDPSIDFLECSIPTPGSNNLFDEEPEVSYSDESLGCDAAVILITEFYYHAHTNIKNEYVCLFNPTSETRDISGWYLTDEPYKEPDDQPKIIFPENTQIHPNSSLCIAQNATAFFFETVSLPDFEYAVDSEPGVPQLQTYQTVTFSNTGGLLGLFTPGSILIDLVIFGDSNQYMSCWDGPSVPSSGQGVILKRNRINGTFLDTNTAQDWIHSRIYHIGQSDFPLETVESSSEIIVFVSPDNSYEVLVKELRNAHCSIDINMYEFTNPFLYAELIDTLNRNVSVRLFMEGSPIGGIDEREKYILTSLSSNGAHVRFIVSDQEKHINARYRFNHAKYLIIDNETVIVESCNWAKTGVPKNPTYGNREWGLVIRDRQIARRYLQVFEEDWNPLRVDSIALDSMNMTSPEGFFLSYEIPTGSYTPVFFPKIISSSSRLAPVFSPDTSEQAILDVLDAATTTIYVQQLYIYKDWGENPSPFVQHLVNKSQQGVLVQIILDYNPGHEDTTALLNETKQFLEANGVKVKFISSDWSPFSTVHNKGVIIDNRTVLVSSINWNEQSVRKNREAGILLENQEAATYFAGVFLSDWSLDAESCTPSESSWAEYKYLVFIAGVVCVTLVLIARDWRKRKWR
ncbi:MAG: lamin tail domain-containing protein [Candidatus Thermoplasmatota archaeon]|nr:lamin tail domain-containing protein [Candidatus Thermoplasmatota archaeon]